MEKAIKESEDTLIEEQLVKQLKQESEQNDIEKLLIERSYLEDVNKAIKYGWIWNVRCVFDWLQILTRGFCDRESDLIEIERTLEEEILHQSLVEYLGSSTPKK